MAVVPRPHIVVTGVGTACAVGTGTEALWNALASGRDGLREIKRFSVLEFVTRIAGLWPAWEGQAPEACDVVELATVSAREAWTAASAGQAAPGRVGLVLGTCFGDRCDGFSELARSVGRVMGVRGPCLTVPTACAASTTAIGLGRDLIEEGAADLVLAGGVDMLTREIFAGFHAIGVLSREKCAPFGESPGLSLGEGSGFVVLETLESAQARQVKPLAHVLGYGLSADAYHETSPDPSGGGIMRAIRAALADSGILPGEVDFVSAHGTGTESNDAAEWLAVRSTIGEQVPISSAKSFLGHAQGAAGVLELAALLLCMRRGLIPPTLRAHPPRPGAPADPVAADRPRMHRVRRALKLSAAFGGANAALLIGRDPAIRPSPTRRVVTITGLAAVSPRGLGLQPLEDALASRLRLEGRVPHFDLARLVRSAPPRDLDPSGRLVTATAALALADAGTAVRGGLRERCGIFLGNTRMSPLSVDECRTSIERRGITHVAGIPFSRMAVNAPAGTCAKLLSLKGPLLTVSAGRASGLLAIVRAAAHLAARRCADLLVAGGLDELPVRGAEGLVEGAAFAVLTAAESDVAAPRLQGWGVAGPGQSREAIARAREGSPEIDGVFSAAEEPSDLLRAAGVDPASLPLGLVDLYPFAGGAEAAGSAMAFVLACGLLRKGAARSLLVLAASDTIVCAVVVTGGSRGR